VVVASEVLDLPAPEAAGASSGAADAGRPREGRGAGGASLQPEVRAVWTSPPGLVERAALLKPAPPGTWAFRIFAGRVVTAGRVVASAAGKRQLGERLGAFAVDMESAAVFQIAAARGIPSLSIRAILDDADREIPFDFGQLLTPTGRPRPFRFLEALAWEPERIRDLMDLRARARTAAESLEAYVPRLVEELAAP
jgi:hypothetical protein